MLARHSSCKPNALGASQVTFVVQAGKAGRQPLAPLMRGRGPSIPLGPSYSSAELELKEVSYGQQPPRDRIQMLGFTRPARSSFLTRHRSWLNPPSQLSHRIAV